jgi:PAS domain S-box-containing protein
MTSTSGVPDSDLRALLGAVAAASSFEGSLDAICHGVEALLRDARCTILLVDRVARVLEPGSAPSMPADFVALTRHFPIDADSATCGRAAATRQVVITEDITTAPSWSRWAAMVEPFGLRSCWSVPILTLDATVVGTFAIYRQRVGAPAEYELRLMEDVARVAALLIGRSQDHRTVASEDTLRDAIESRRFIDRIMQAIPDVVYTFDLAERRMTFVTPSCERVVGYSVAEIMELGAELWMRLVHPEDLAALAVYTGSWKDTMDPVVRSIEYRILHRTGGWRSLVQRSLVLSRDAQGQPTTTLGVLQDVTEIRLSEQRLRQAERMEALGRLAGGIAHDFNNLLTVILHSAESVDGAITDGAAREANADVMAAATRARDLVHRILTFSRMREAVRERFRLTDVVGEAVRFFVASKPSTLELDVQLTGECCELEGDASQFQQVVLNLCANAEYALRGVRDAQLEVWLTPEIITDDTAASMQMAPGRWAHLTVRDNGSGMSEDALARVFEPFFTTKPQGDGTGLGMAVTLGIVQSHGGHVQVHSQLHRGTTVEVWVPLLESGKEVRPAPVPVVDTTRAPRARRVLVVDDEPAVARALTRLLTSIGHEVTTETDPEEALQSVVRNPMAFDVILTDQTMPGMTGDALARAVLSIRPDLPVVLCSGYSEHYQLDDSQRDGIRAFLTKPLDREQVRSVLDSLG